MPSSASVESPTIIVRGAREHNLRNVHLELPRNRLIVFTGVSGSGKSSLAFDTLYAEGQRRYIQSLSSYARQFLGQLPKPEVDFLSGLSPSISIQQKSASRNPRSTVGTITEIYDYLRVLFARVGRGHCPECGRPITAQSPEQIVERILALPEGTRCLILAPVVRKQKGEHKDLLADLLRRGFVRARVDGQVVHLTEELRLDRNVKHDIEVVVDRLRIGSGPAGAADAAGTAAGSQPDAGQGRLDLPPAGHSPLRSRVAEAVEQALQVGQGNLILSLARDASTAGAIPVLAPGDKPASRGSRSRTSQEAWEDVILSARYACLHCDRGYEPPSPQLFSFNSPQGMCPQCDGLGMRHQFDLELLIPDDSKSLWDGAIPLLGPIKDMGRWRRHIYQGVAETLGIDLRRPWRELPEEHRQWLLWGAGSRHITFTYRGRYRQFKHGGVWQGIIPQLESSYKKTAGGPYRALLEKYMTVRVCPSCRGARLNAQARAVRVGGKTITEVCAMSIGELAEWLAPAGTHNDSRSGTGRLLDQLTPLEARIAQELLKEIRTRVQFLLDVGLQYLSLDRPAPTLSGGEAQRIRLAGQIGSGLVGVLYILDEPSIGLHPRDNERLLRSLERLRDMGNTVLIVEHDEETMRRADFLVDFGPGPGQRGGQVVAAGSFEEVLEHRDSLTAQYLRGDKEIPVPARRRPRGKAALKVVGACHNNLKNITVEVPLGLFVAVTGVSGSGKSSLVNDIILEGLRQKLGCGPESEDGEGEDEVWHVVGRHKRITGFHHLDKVIAIDQSPIGRTPRSNPATYIKVLDHIRGLLAQVPQARVRGYDPGRFSFNVPGGRCEACQGMGSTRLEMDFLADVWVTCPVCEGRRFNRETLQVRFKDKNIHEILEMNVAQALEHFADVPKVRAMLQTLHDVGLDYLRLGQPSPTLSGGEAQRIKLARELCKRSTGRTLYILDEPTTGLHFDDIRKLLAVLHGFVDQGNTVLVIEHNLDVIKTADWVIDLGPEGGEAGGYVVAVGTPEEIAECPRSYTGQALRSVLGKTARPSRLAVQARSSRQSPTRDGRPPGPDVQPRGEKPGNGAGFGQMQSDGEAGFLTVVGASQHNLKHVTVSLPRQAMTVFCGPSGSGKSSLAIDTIYAEGQRRYVESLSAYARQFLGRMDKPKVEQITGLSPAICIEQKSASKNPRSTVGTVTEIHDYLRVLYARLGQPYCPGCQVPIGTQTADEIIDKVLSLPEGTRLYVLAPMERKGQEKYEVLWEEIQRAGYVRVRVDGVTYSIEEPPAIDQRRKHVVEIVVDRLTVRPGQRSRIAEAIEAALALGKGIARIALVADDVPEPRWKVESFSQQLACPQCGRSFEPLNPHHFSFNSPLGWCPACEGLGVQRGIPPALLIRDAALPVGAGALSIWPDVSRSPELAVLLASLAAHLGFSLDTPFRDLTPAQQSGLLYGTGSDWIPVVLPEGRLQPASGTSSPASPSQSQGSSAAAAAADPTVWAGVRFQYRGLLGAVEEACRVSPACRQKLDAFVQDAPCHRCRGTRLREDAAAVRFQGHTLHELGEWPLSQTLAFFQNLSLTAEQRQVAGELLRELCSRLQFLVDVGLDYLTLNRPAPTLSGGEAQRIRLASQIGSGLTGVLYVLDEPTIGLHPRDNSRLIQALTRLRDLGNTLVVVEHDREVIATADHLLDFGPGAGDQGGQIVAQGPPARIQQMEQSLTGQYLSGRKAIPVPTNRRIASPSGQPERALVVQGARQNNLKNIDVAFPLGCLIAVTGVSGSGKSSLVHEVLYNTLARRLHRLRTPIGRHDAILGLEHIDKVINVDQSPLGTTPTSNPATYTGVFDLIRRLFAQVPEAKVRGWQPRRFSFNQPGGRCEACQGMGQKLIEMHFLPDVWVECDVCHGARYNAETLAVRYKGKNIAEVLDLRVSEALELFGNIPSIRRILQTLADVGLEYLALGQPAPTLSGGEAQRVKLAAELARPSTGRTVYILDEPTTGLHFDDIRKLLDVLHRLVDLGNTVIVVEHNLDVIKTADWVIDMGPEAGERGGYVVAVGTPEEICGLSRGASGRDGQTPLRHQAPGDAAASAGLGDRPEAPPASAPPPQHRRSYTAEYLAPVLAAGPWAERKPYDPAQADQPREGDLEIEQIAEGVAMPWETDGRRWHTVDRVSRSGAPCRWEGAALAWVVDRIQESGRFAPTRWNDRTQVEIAPPSSPGIWFLHASTADEWFLWLKFRVRRRAFSQGELEARLGILPPDQTPGLETYGDFPRVRVRGVRGGSWDSVEIGVHWLREVQTPAFDQFLHQAIASFEQQLSLLDKRPAEVMPWKVDGRRWHVGEWRHKGFPPGQRVQWNQDLLAALVQVVEQADAKLALDWNHRDAVPIRLEGKPWGRIKTKDPRQCELRFWVPKGLWNRSRLEGRARRYEFLTDHPAKDIVVLAFQQPAEVQPAVLTRLLREAIRTVREAR
jgi:excinuclease ABC subunit A